MSGRPAAGEAGVAAGLWRLALLRADGVACFSATREALLASFTPWLAIGIVFALYAARQGWPLAGLSTLAQIGCLVLAVPVLSHPLLRAWGVEARWLRFATVGLWSLLLPNLLALVLGSVADVALAAGADAHAAVLLPVLFLIGYALRLYWLVARTTLGLGWGRTLLLLLWMGVSLSIISQGPALLREVLQAPAAQGAGSAA